MNFKWPGKYPDFWTGVIWDAIRAALQAWLGVMGAKSLFGLLDLRVAFGASLIAALTSISMGLKGYPPKNSEEPEEVSRPKHLRVE